MLVLDVETTGTDPKRNSIVSIGVVDFEKPERRFYGECRIWEGAEISQAALDVNGFTRKDITDSSKKPHNELIQELHSWLADCSDLIIAGENPWFDRDFLNESFAHAELSSPFGRRAIDLHSVCCAHMVKRGLPLLMEDQKSDLNTDRILEYVGVSARTGAHNALEDAKLEAEAFARLIYGKNLLVEYCQFPIPKYLIE